MNMAIDGNRSIAPFQPGLQAEETKPTTGVATRIDAVPQAGTTEHGAGLSTPRKIMAPVKSFSPEDMIALIEALVDKGFTVMQKHVGVRLEAARDKIKSSTDAQLAKLKEWADAAAKEPGTLKKVFGWGLKILGVVGAAVGLAASLGALPLTAGGSTPLVVISAIGLMAAVTAVADGIAAEVGADFEGESSLLSFAFTKLGQKIIGNDTDEQKHRAHFWGGMIGLILTPLDPQLAGMFAKSFVEKDATGAEAQKTATITTLVVSGLMLLAMVGTMIATFNPGKAADIAKEGAKIASTIETAGAAATSVVAEVAKDSGKVAAAVDAGGKAASALALNPKTSFVLQTGVTATTGLTSLGNAGVTAYAGYFELQTTLRRAESMELIAWHQKLQAALSECMDDLKRIMEAMESHIQGGIDVITGVAESNSRIANNMSRQSA